MSEETRNRDYYSVLDVDGSLLVEDALADIPDELLLSMFEDMKLVRHYDRTVVSLQRQGRIGTYPPMYGHEATQVASVYALEDDDWLFPTYRENGAAIVHGMEIHSNLMTWMGNPEGQHFGDDLTVFPIANPIATHIPHATGTAWAAKMVGDDRAVLCHFGDGATSEGDFHEGLNFAGVFDVPAVFFCNNNQWAISVPRERQTKSDTLAQKSRGYGFENVRVDGMDPIAVYLVTRDAVKKAKNPDKGELRPTLIEAVMYRLGAHSTSDDPSVYIAEGERDDWAERDPLPRFASFLRETGRLSSEQEITIESRAEERVAEAIEIAEAHESEPAEIFDEVFADLPPRLRSQRSYLLERIRRGETGEK